MLRDKTRSVKERIVSFHKSNIRPIAREKAGKEVEFGLKVSVSHVDGYLLLDKFSTEAYHEGVVLNESISLHEKRFGKKPEIIITDKIYGSRENRESLAKDGIRASLVPLGRRCKRSKQEKKWVKQKQQKHNEIEGRIGVSKVHYGLERLGHKIPPKRDKNEELNIHLGLIAMNLSTAMARI